MNATSEIRDQAAQWVLRREEPDWSPDNEAELSAWLNQSMAHKAAYWRLKHDWRALNRIAALGPSAAPVRPVSILAGRFWKPLALAASILATVGAGLLYWQSAVLDGKSDTHFATTVGGHRVIPLGDGSKVELNTATVVRTAMERQARQVWLDRGEAYFEVAHIDGKPFIVHAGRQTVTVLGTKFSVRRDGDSVTVSVVEGKVRIDDAENPRAIRSTTINGGDVAIARGVATLVTSRSQDKVQNTLAWREGMLAFQRSRLGDVVDEFNRYNRKPIVIADPQVSEIRIGGKFPAANVEAFTRLLRDAYGLHVKNTDEAINISE